MQLPELQERINRIRTMASQAPGPDLIRWGLDLCREMDTLCAHWVANRTENLSKLIPEDQRA